MKALPVTCTFVSIMTPVPSLRIAPSEPLAPPVTFKSLIRMPVFVPVDRKIRELLFPLMVSRSAPGPRISIDPVRTSSPCVSVIVWAVLNTDWLN